MTTDGGGWTQLYDQDTTVPPGYLPTSSWASGVTNTAPNGGQFSILQMTSHFGQGGQWEFLLDWDDRDTSIMWIQSEDPFVGRGTVTSILEIPANQTGECTGEGFSGLSAEFNGSSTLDGNDNACWWWAVGTSAPWVGGIPAYHDSDNGELVAMRARLWVR